MGYWNKIRVTHPDVFERMAAEERRLGFSLNTVFLDELRPDQGRYELEEDIECGVLCQVNDQQP